MRLVSRCRVKLAVLAICSLMLVAGGGPLQAASDGTDSAPASEEARVLDPADPSVSLEREGLGIEWSQRIPDGGDGYGLRTVYPVEDTVMLETNRANLFVVDAQKGTWRGGASFRALLDEKPVAGEQYFYLLSGGQVFFMSKEDGKIKEEKTFRFGAISAPVYFQETLLLGTGDGKLLRVDLSNAAEMWRRSAGGMITREPRLQGSMIYVVGQAGVAMAVEIGSGTMQWSWKPSDPADITSSFGLGEKHMYVADTLGFVHCLETEVGIPLWRYPAGGAVRKIQVLPESRLFVSTYGKSSMCIDVSDGPKLCWTYPHRSELVGLGENNTLYLTTQDNLLSAVSMGTGKELWRRKLPEDVHAKGEPTTSRFYLFDDAGTVLAVDELD